MSTIRVGTISNAGGTQSTAAENVINGSAKAWVNFNGTGTVAIRGQYNVSSITDNGVGDYTVNFTTAMVDINYCGQVLGCGAAGFGNLPWQVAENTPSGTSFARTTSSFRINCLSNTGAAFVDGFSMNVAIFR